MNGNDAGRIGAFFDDKWHLYQQAIRSDVLCHQEMFDLLDRELVERFGNAPFCIADFGCGDSTAVVETLRNKPITHYFGVDAAPALITAARETLSVLNCRKTLICKNMADAITDMEPPIDSILCSYSLHHLHQDQKASFIEACYEKLSHPGYFFLIDGVVMENETRDEWLQRLDRRILEKVPGFSAEDRNQIMQHPRESDFPETIQTFRSISRRSPWRSFEVPIHRDDFLAFMIFVK